MFRWISLAVIVALGVWALWPRGSATAAGDAASAAGSSPGVSPGQPTTRFVIRVAPGMYMPGRRPMDLGQPLRALAKVAGAFEKLYPDTRIEFTEAPVGSREYLVTQLGAGQAPEILNVNVEDVWQDIQKGWYVVLDPYLDAPNPFIAKGETGSRQWWDQFKYQAISRGKAAPDGKYYCITFDMVETGVFYNKAIFQRLGIDVPRDWVELQAISEKIRRAGLIPFLIDSVGLADWGMDLVFNQVYQGIIPGIDLTQDPKRDAYMPDYLDWDEIAFLNTKGFFTRRDPRFVETFRILKAWRKTFSKSMDSNMTRLFVTGRAAMWWTGSWAVNRLVRDKDVDFDWGVFYLPPIPRSVSRFADGHGQVVIGGSGTQFEVTNSAFDDTHDPATSTKLKRTIAFLQFLTVPKNTDAVVNEVLAFLPNVVGAEPRPELMPFHIFLQRPYTNTKWLYTFDLRFNEIYRRMLDLYLNDGLGDDAQSNEDEFLAWMENNVRTACETVVRRKGIDLSKLEGKWRELAPVRASSRELPPEP